MEKWNLILGNRILSTAKRRSFLSAITKAERGYGKSMYNYKCMAQAYYNYESCSEDYAWNKALDNIIFTPDQLMKKIEDNIANDHISLVWCIDDAAVHFSSYLYFINIYHAALLNAYFDTIRTVVSALLLNCPNKKRLLAGLRSYDDHEITIYKNQENGYERRAVGIKWYSLPDGKRKYRKVFEDNFSCYVPDEYYNKYMLKRKKYLEEISEELQKLKVKLSTRSQKKEITEIEEALI